LSAATVYRKTAKGNAEINAKGGGLDRKLRPLLILVDGHRGSDVIISLAAGIGIEAGALKQLEADGYIEPLRVTSAPPVAAARSPATASAGAPPRTVERTPSARASTACATARST
jgi:hypothetical protein